MRNTVSLAFIFLLVFAPLAFGTTGLWALTITESGAVAALLVYLLGRRQRDAVFYRTPGLVPLILFLCYILAQLLPLPAGLIKFISPATWQLYHAAFGPLSLPGGISISIDKKATIAAFFRFSAYAAFYVLTIQLLVRRERLKKTAAIVAVFAVLPALLAIVLKLTSAPAAIYGPRSSGLFAFRAPETLTFAGLTVILLPMA
ncbi:MAG TPA: hypothetical protein ENK33_01185, partial [Desulfobacterales bacterium]|nr:hypothetical protein [Desulfobacterales bacterium]